MKAKEIVLTGCLFLLSYSSLFAQKKLDEGLQAFDLKDYKKAFTLLQPLAETGNCMAQYAVGLSYQYGYYVAENDSVARHWLTLSSEQKQANAMGPLAANLMMHSQTKPDEMVYAYMWAVLAAEYSQVQRATATRGVIKSYLEPGQLEKAEKLIKEYELKWKAQENCQ